MAVSASNAMDQLLFKQDLGIDALPWPSLALNKGPQINEIDTFEPMAPRSKNLLYTQLEPYFYESFVGRMHWWMLDASRGGRDFGFDDSHYNSDKHQDYAAVLIFPYNVQVTKFVEYYMSGMPLLCPSLKLWTWWHKKYRVCFHRTPGYLPDNEVLQWNQSLFPESMNSPCCEVHARARQHAHYWLPMADFYHWPHVTYFDSDEELRTKFLEIRDNPGVRQALIKGMMEYKKRMFERSSSVLLAQLAAFQNAEREGTMCSEFGLLGI